jgi:hypothetical protein
MCWACTRIWWVLPVWSFHRTTAAVPSARECNTLHAEAAMQFQSLDTLHSPFITKDNPTFYSNQLAGKVMHMSLAGSVLV